MNDGPNYVRIRVDAVQKIQTIAKSCSHFKIGKTGQALADRFDSEYKETYDRIEPIYRSSQKSEVDELEAYLIEYFQALDKYVGQCDNKAVGGGEIDSSSTYYVYVVAKD